MKTYRVHYRQINEGWIEIKASSKESAVNKATIELKSIYPALDTIELPNGEQKDIYG